MVPLSEPGAYSDGLLPSLSEPQDTLAVITLYPPPQHTHTLPIHSSPMAMHSSVMPRSLLNLHKWSSCLRLCRTFFLICASCVHSEHYGSSWMFDSPVALIHQHLILRFDLRCLLLASARLERPGPSVSSRSLREQERRFHGSHCSDSRSADLRSLSSQQNNYTTGCPITLTFTGGALNASLT